CNSTLKTANNHHANHSFPTRLSSDLDYKYLALESIAITLLKSNRLTQEQVKMLDPVFAGSAFEKALLNYEKTKIINEGRLLSKEDRKSTRLNSSHVKISYDVLCLKKK